MQIVKVKIYVQLKSKEEKLSFQIVNDENYFGINSIRESWV